jgi:hypothetical protein
MSIYAFFTCHGELLGRRPNAMRILELISFVRAARFETDVERLILLVEDRPVLRDKTIGQYKYKSKTLEAWKEMCALLK